MWPWFHSSWIIILPLAMMVLCILMCILRRGRVFRGYTMCCGYRHGESDAESERSSQSDS